MRNEWRQTRCYIDPKFFFNHSSTSFSSWVGVAQPWITEGCKALSLQADSHAGILSPTDSNRLGTWLYYCLTFTCFRCSSAYLHRCISLLTARWGLGWGWTKVSRAIGEHSNHQNTKQLLIPDHNEEENIFLHYLFGDKIIQNCLKIDATN